MSFLRARSINSKAGLSASTSVSPAPTDKKSVTQDGHMSERVQVYVRIRPPVECPALLETSSPAGASAIALKRVASQREGTPLRTISSSWLTGTPQREGSIECDPSRWDWTPHSMVYDKDIVGTYESVFSPDTSTEHVYEQVARPVVQRLLDGYDGCVYAFGQTNSGKTYTIHGTLEQPGVVVRAAQQIFDFIEAQSDVVSMLRVSFLELYNETIRDLLGPSAESGLLASTDDAAWNDGGAQIVKDPDRGVFVAGLYEKQVTSLQDVLAAIQDGQRRRSIAANYAHELASRSHTIFQLIFESRNVHQRQVRVSTLHIVDMAGSEASSNTIYETPMMTASGSPLVPGVAEDPQSIAERASPAQEKKRRDVAMRNAEGANIRKSLLALVRCVEILSRGNESGGTAHVPYRDSKLTRLLSGTLGGSTHTTVLCTINPAEVKESFKTLRFANLAQRIINYPRKVSYLSNKALLIRYDEEVERMRREVEDMKASRLHEEDTLRRNMEEQTRTMSSVLKQKLSAREEALRRLEALQKFVLTSRVQDAQGQTFLKQDRLRIQHAGDEQRVRQTQANAFVCRTHSFATLRDPRHRAWSDDAAAAHRRAMAKEAQKDTMQALRAEYAALGKEQPVDALPLTTKELESLYESVERAWKADEAPAAGTTRNSGNPSRPAPPSPEVLLQKKRKIEELRDVVRRTALEYESQKAAIAAWATQSSKKKGCFSSNVLIDVEAHAVSESALLANSKYAILKPKYKEDLAAA